MKNPIFSIIVPNWNGEKFLKSCFLSLQKQTIKYLEIIMVDNGSEDDSVSFTKENFPGIKIIELKKNYGFAKAVNIGIKEAKGGLIALLNNDTEADPNWLSEILEASKREKNASFFASKMLDFKKRDVIDSCGDGLNWSGRAYGISKGQKDSPKFEKEKFVFGATAGAAVYKKELIEKVGAFDEDFYMYLEDVDFDLRAQLLGLKCLYVPSAKVYHLGSATAGKDSPFIFKYITRNRWYLMKKNFPWQKILFNSPRIFFSELRYLMAAIRHNFIKEYFWAVKEAIKNSPKMSLKRNKVMRSRTVTFKELDEVIK